MEKDREMGSQQMMKETLIMEMSKKKMILFHTAKQEIDQRQLRIKKRKRLKT